ncbi:hypothetical protein B0H17DRAFT_1049809 [Mycena rosella]|uniref:PLOD1-3-like GT domain-containing protein n=1 Tax=Mycena rosella TaxID=1033263 RepID=A0AAD7DSW1_MYCRO|nr:hypothetical protein B0H17DRAFT_1049809 [Mycena rosella]
MSSQVLNRYLRLSFLLLAATLVLLTLPALLYHKNKLRYFSSDGRVDVRPRKLFHLLPINSGGAGPLFCKVLMSSLVHGYSPIILNWEAEGDGSYMQRLKVAGVYEFLLGLPGSEELDVVFMTDAWDVWLQLPPAVLLERYDEYGSNMVVIGADMVCWPNDWEEPACREVPESPVPEIAYEELGNTPRWANSGTIIGTVKSMKAVYSDLIVRLSEKAATDQGIFNEFLHQGRITVDYWSRLFWVTASNVDSGTIVNTRHPVSAAKDDTIPYHLLPPMLYHSRTGEYPVALHFNDHVHKHLLDEWWGRLWWTKPGFKSVWEKHLESGTAQFAHNGSMVRWEDLCGDTSL